LVWFGVVWFCWKEREREDGDILHRRNERLVWFSWEERGKDTVKEAYISSSAPISTEEFRLHCIVLEYQ
jgi:hypothetical protein